MLLKCNGTLVRVRNGEALRADSVTGWFADAPTPGVPFVFFAPPLDPQARLRVVTTSPVVEIRATVGGFEFQTHNSVYRLNDVHAADL
jgi:hypothetical protein